MGDRGNIHWIDVIGVDGEEDKGFYFYTHWGRSHLGEVLADALERGRSRWDDPSYLARIVFSEMTKGQEQDLTGYGISTWLGDGDVTYTIDAEKGTVMDSAGHTSTFAKFVNGN